MIELKWHPYKYFEYEKELAFSEVEQLLNPDEIKISESGVIVRGSFDSNLAKKLVYFASIEDGNETIKTIQNRLENSQNIKKVKRQSTRYSVHGMHEYKGKFNPQVVRGIINMLGIKTGQVLYDPFCGSGTSLCEGSIAGLSCFGTDINPMAVYLSNAKIKALSIEPDAILSSFRSINFDANNDSINDSEREDYLRKWLPRENFIVLENFRNECLKLNSDVAQVLLALVSDLIRGYSLQEPGDLRIRRRRTPFPDKPLRLAINEKVEKFVSVLKSSKSVIGIVNTNSHAILHDNRKKILENLHPTSNIKFDVAITSPPYAMALPYIDTQRLSLIWLNLCTPSELRNLEESLTGSREINTKKKKEEALRSLLQNENQLPVELHKFCLELYHSLSEKDGFRRQAVPILLYRYYSQMKDSFITVKNKLNKGAYYALIVGSNKTTIGGNLFHIDTPKHLEKIALSVGWSPYEMRSLQTYKRYDLHNANGINSETLIIVQNNA